MPGTQKRLVCVIDDDLDLNKTLCDSVQALGYRVVSFSSAVEFLESGLIDHDVIISDISMPGLSGYDLCKTVRKNEMGVRMPLILITGDQLASERAIGLEAGADDFLQKPFRMRELKAKLESLLKIRAQEIRTLGRVDQLSRFLPPNLVDLITHENRQLLKPHRAEVSVLFVDLRRFTAFSEKFGPEEVLSVLERYYAAVGGAAIECGGTIGHLAGDGIMIFFNDPIPVTSYRDAAVDMALVVRALLNEQRVGWLELGYDIDFGIGLSEGDAIIGKIGFEHFSHYSVIGPVTNLASRLSDVAARGQILMSDRFMSRLIPDSFQTESVGSVSIKGIGRPVHLHNVISRRDPVKRK